MLLMFVLQFHIMIQIIVVCFFFRSQACNVIKNKTLAQVFSCEFCEIFKNTFFTEDLRRLLLFFKTKITENANVKNLWIKDLSNLSNNENDTEY